MISHGMSRRAFISRAALGGVTGMSALSPITSLSSAALGAQEARAGHRFVTANGIRIHLAELGKGPLVTADMR